MASKKFDQLFGSGPRVPESEITQFYKDIAASIRKLLKKLSLGVQTTSIKSQAEKLMYGWGCCS